MSDNMTLKQQNLSSIHIYGSRNVKYSDCSYIYLIYIKYVHVNVNMRWRSRDN